MSENDLSDEAFEEWVKTGLESSEYCTSYMLQTWRECRRRHKANRWAAFSDEELEAELERRKAGQDLKARMGFAH